MMPSTLTTMMNRTPGSNQLYVSCQFTWMTVIMTLSNDDSDKNDAININIDTYDYQDKNYDTEITTMMI